MNRQSAPRLVIFDIDGTLVPGSSSEVRFARYLARHRMLGVRQILAFVGFTLRYWPRYRATVLQKNKAYLSGLAVQRVEALARAFVTESLVPALYGPTLKRLRAHQAAGDSVALLSGTPEFIASALASALDVETSIGAECASENGRFLAHLPLTHPHGKTKLDAAEKLAEQSGLPLASAVAYGDSMHDAWLFRAVGEGVAVMPDRGLRATASGEGWEIFG